MCAPVGVLDSRGLVNLKLSLYTAAIDDYDAALKLNPKQASSLYGRGIAKLMSGSSAAGNSYIAAAKAINPGIADEFGGYGIR
jgi:tetratricopeptide (TPR) repeat protein